LTDADVRRLLLSGELIRLAHGLVAGYRRERLANDEVANLVLRIQGMQRRYPNAIAAFRTAARLHQLWLLGPPGPVHLVRPAGRRREKHDVWVETANVPESERAVVRGVEATSISRTTADLAARLAPAEALAVADCALRRGQSLAAVLAIAQEHGLSRDHLAWQVLAMADARSESLLESVSRWSIHTHRLPPPQLQVTLRDDAGPFARVDFLWEEQRVVGEADGMLKYDDPVALRAEKLRQERIERTGRAVVRWGFADIMRREAETIRRLSLALKGRHAA
jgi:very-short-patch-repair endonuclease